jgi:RNA polymerase sigma-70 factor (ECF subfamily)
LVIKPSAPGHSGEVTGSAERVWLEEAVRPSLTALFEAHYDFVWRSLRRMGVLEAGVDDAAQEVFVVAARKLDRIERGAERAFLFATALRVAADARRARARRHEVAEGSEVLDAVWATGPDLDELVEHKRARELLDHVLDSMPNEVRAVFALYELEGLTMAEIAGCTGAAPGTVASRLRRGREIFEGFSQRIRAKTARAER